MRHFNDGNDVGDVVWFDPVVGGNCFVLEVYSRQMPFSFWSDIAFGSKRSSDQDLAEILLDLQASVERGGG